AVGLFVGRYLTLRFAPASRTRRAWQPNLVLAASGLLIAAGFFVTTDVDALVADRSQTIVSAMQGRDDSFDWRVQKWRRGAGIAAQMVDAMANGSWRYPECGIFFWLVLGLGVAVIRMAYQPPLQASEGRQQAAVASGYQKGGG